MDIENLKKKVSSKMMSPNSGSNFETHVLKNGKSGRLHFRPTVALLLFGFLFLAITSVGIYYMIIRKIATNTLELNTEGIVSIIVLSLFLGVTIYLLYFAFRPLTFDKKNNVFTKG